MEGQEILPNNSGQKTVSKTTPVKSRSGISGSGSSCKSPSKMVAVLEKAANDGQLFKAWYVSILHIKVKNTFSVLFLL